MTKTNKEGKKERKKETNKQTVLNVARCLRTVPDI